MNKCPKCGDKNVNTKYSWGEDKLIKICRCGYRWREDCLDKKQEEK